MTPHHFSARSSRLRRIRSIAVTVTLLTALGAASAPAAVAAPTTPSTAASATPTAPTPTQPTSPAAYEDGRYIVTLRAEAVATYSGGTDGFAATRANSSEDLRAHSKRAVAYSEHLAEEQVAVAEAVDAEIISSYTLATNGFSSELTGDQAAKLAADPRVASIVPDELLHIQQAVPSTDFLGLSGEGGVWDALGGVDTAGDGVVVGIIDTGLAPENPSFAGRPLGDAVGDEPYRDGDAIVFEKSDGSVFRGVCEPAEQWQADDCSTKVIGARYFVDNYGEEFIGRDRGEVISPRDGAGHGSHTASTAVGEHGVPATVAGRDLGEISGVAPAAKLAVYKVCWTGPSALEDGCATGDLLAAIDAAVLDGVDVINYSIGGGAAQTTVSVTDQAFLRAAAAGIFVAASAGNAGPEASTADNAAPWITTVAASTIPSYEATVRLGDGRTFPGGSITVPEEGLTGPLVTASSVALAEASGAQLCASDTLDPALAAGRIVLCDRGEVDRTEKSAEVARVGGIGMVLVNPTPDSVDVDAHAVPTVHVDAEWYEALSSYARTAGATVTLEDGNTTGLPSPPTPQIAGFSSRGPIVADGGDILKPDLTAPGVAILADGRNAEGAEPTFQLMSGTSMSSPHVAGLAALYLGEHPQAAPAEIKSALMTTAYDTVDAAGAPTYDPFAQGAGHVDPTRFLEPGFVFRNDVDDWLAYVQGLGIVDLGVPGIDPSNLNLASASIGSLAGRQTITRTVTATAAGRYEAQPVEMAGVDVTVSPSALEFGAAGDEVEIEISFERTDAPLDAFTTGTLRWTGEDGDAVMPLAVRPTLIAVPGEVAGDGIDGSVEITVAAGDTTDLPVAVEGFARGQVAHGIAHAGGEPQRHVVDVAEGVTSARFDLDSADDTADLDLRLYEVDPFGGTWFLAGSTSPNGDERITMPDLAAGRYVLEVEGLSGDGDLEFDLTSYLLGAEPDAGAPAVDPEVLHLQLGEPSSLTASWSGLEPASTYFGRVRYGELGRFTNLIVTTPGDPAAGDEDLAITVAPEYVRPGRLFAVEAVGLDSRAPYSITLDGAPLTAGLAGDDGTAARQVLLPEDVAEGSHVVRIESGGETAETTVVASVLVLHEAWEKVEYLADGTATAAVDIYFAGEGSAHAVIRTAGGTIVSDQRFDLWTDPEFDVDIRRTDAVEVTPGDYVLSVEADATAGADPQRLEHAFTVEEREPNALTLTQNPDDENAMDLVYTNAAGVEADATMRYKTCAGAVVFASLWIADPVVTGTFDLTAITGVDVMLEGRVLGSYANPGSDRCAATPTITNDFWVTLADPSLTDDAGPKPTTSTALDDGTPTPISMTMSNRFAAYSHGFDLFAGVGSDYHLGEFYAEGVPHDHLTVPGPVESRTVDAPEGEALWARAFFEVRTPIVHYTAQRVVTTTAVTLADLAPYVEPGEPGEPDGPGQPGGPADGGGGGGGGGAPGGGSSPTGASRGDLASTGVDAIPYLVLAGLAALLGAGLMVGRARRRRDSAGS